MKKAFALVLTLCMLTGLLCACGDRSAQNGGTPNGGTVGNAGIEELPSYVRYTSTYNSNGNIRNDETVMNFQWTDDGVTMEGYQVGDNTRADVVLEAKLDGQKRPQWIARTVTRSDGEKRQSKVEFAYPNDRKIAFTRDGETWENVYATCRHGRRMLTAIAPGNGWTIKIRRQQIGKKARSIPMMTAAKLFFL